MAQKLPHLTWLRAFEASARHLSFTSAAAELNLTQAAVSKQVKLLEQFLGEPLFERRPRSLALTKIGAAYLPKVRDGFDRILSGTEEVFGGRLSDALTLRAPVGFAVTWIAPRLRRFTEAYPDCPIRLISSVWDEASNAPRVDMEIRYGTGDWSGLVSDRLTWEVFEPLCAPSLLSNGPPLVHPNDLRHHQLLHVLGYEEGWSTWLRSAGVEGVNPGQGMQFDNSLAVFEFAAAGGGVALGRSSMSGPMLDSGRLIRPFHLPVPLNEAFYLTAPSGRAVHPKAGLLREWLLHEAERAPQRRPSPITPRHPQRMQSL
ncbi:MAG: transcriptional regulator GcvA [Pseudomonadota bacterium]|nr:transcriptional regulator GcvA [Pseudomonadota bacterium]MEC8295429.1 transcriptional regulator GcvA [Pseudomonadota bacterium]